MKLNGNLVLNTLGQSEVRNLVVERVASTPEFFSAEAGRVIFNTTDGKYYINTGVVWIDIATGGNAATIQTEVDKLETALGGMVTADGTFNGSALAGTNIVNATSLTNAISQLDAAISGKKELAELLDVNVAGVTNAQFLRWDSTAAKWVAHTLVAASLTDVTATATEINYLSGVTSSVQTQLDNEVTLRTTAVSNLQTELDATKTGAGLGATGAYTAPAGTAVLGTATSLADADVKLDAAITAEAGTRSGADLAIQNELDATQTGAGLDADGDYVVPTTSNYLNASTSLADADAKLDTQAKLIADNLAQELIDRAAAELVLQNNINTKVDKAGDAMTGNLVMGTGTHITIPDSPVNGTDAVNKNYLDANLAGLSWKNSVKARSVANIDLAAGGLLTVDGVTLVDGDRVLVSGQTLASENGIYVAAAGAWVRSTDMDQTTPVNELNSAAVFVDSGTLYKDTSWTQINDVSVIGTDDIAFTQFNGASGITAGLGLIKDGNTLHVNLGAGIAELPSDEVGIDLYGTGGIQLVDPTTGLTSVANDGQLAVKRDGTTLTVSADGLRVNQTILDSITTNATDLGTEITARSNADTAIQNELDATQTGAGLNADGTYTAPVGTAALGDATSLADATVKLDAAITAEAGLRTTAVGNVQTELDNSQTGAGLSATGDYVVASGSTYLTTATSLADADTKLDVALKAEVDARILADTALSDKMGNGYFLYTSGAAATSHAITHNIGSQFCNVTVIDAATNEQVIPNSVVFDSTTQLTVTFNTSVQCKVVVMGLGV